MLNLEAKKEQLINELNNCHVNDEDMKKIDEEVEHYRDGLLNEINDAYASNKASIQAKIELIDELIIDCANGEATEEEQEDNEEVSDQANY